VSDRPAQARLSRVADLCPYRRKCGCTPCSLCLVAFDLHCQMAMLREKREANWDWSDRQCWEALNRLWTDHMESSREV